MLIIRRIHVDYYLEGVPPDLVEKAERSHEFHAGYCPVARSLEGAIAITTALHLV